MTPRGDCPEALRRTALMWALSHHIEIRPPGRLDWQHHDIVFQNFRDVFSDREQFDKQLARRRFFRERNGNADSLRSDG